MVRRPRLASTLRWALTMRLLVLLLCTRCCWRGGRSISEMAQALRAAAEPMWEHEVASLLSSRFPRRVTEVQTWEKTSSTVSKAETARRTPTVRGQDIEALA